MPPIRGFSECWGISVIHCPYCHGYEFRNQKTGIFSNGDRAFQLTSLVRNLTDDITLLTSGEAKFNADQLEKLKKHNVEITEKVIIGIEHVGGQIKNVVFNDDIMMNFDALYSPLPFEQYCDIPLTLGCELTEQGYIKVDSFQKTTVEGIFACGDNTAMMRSVANAVAMGGIAGSMTNKELSEEGF